MELHAAVQLFMAVTALQREAVEVQAISKMHTTMEMLEQRVR
jgi:hypothetical protein